jgi:hypothetical protein
MLPKPFLLLPRAGLVESGLVRLRLVLGFVLLAAFCMARPVWAEAAAPAASGPVGKAVFLTGQVSIAPQKGAKRPMRQGDAIAEGDTVRTGADGHVYFRMTDNGFLAVRPNSQLRVEAYAWDPADPSRNRIRLFTDKGVVRSVTGKAGSAARERFRMNTPVAAIGVRGTDFTVSSGKDVIHVAVLQGTVSVSPYGNGCDIDALGPCTGELARDIGENARNMALEVRHMQTPIQVPIQKVPDLQKSNEIRPDEHASRGKNSMTQEKSGTADASNAVTQKESETADAPTAAGEGVLAQEEPGAIEVAQGEKASDGTPDVAGDGGLRQDDAVAIKDSILQGDRDKQVDLQAGQVLGQTESHFAPAIWWGRWQAFLQPGETDKSITALAAAGREITVGNQVYMLYRDREQPMPTGSGVAQFSLTESEAWVKTGGELSPASVLDGRLIIDFGQRAFSTHLSVSEADRIHALFASGRVNTRGFFSDDGRSGMTVTGAVAAQGTQAGYVFSHPLDAVRELTGVTLWRQ